MTADEIQQKPIQRFTGTNRRELHVFSAGGIVVRGFAHHREILLVGRIQSQRHDLLWALPKGTPIPGESVPQTALREVREETGIEVAITGSVGAISYNFIERGTRYRKQVTYYTMIAIGGDTSLHDHEYDLVQWFSLEDAFRCMRYPNEADLVRKLLGIER